VSGAPEKPISPGAVNAPAAAPGVASDPRSGAVLLIEDEVILSSLLTNVFRRVQRPVFHAACGAVALQLLRDHQSEILFALVDCHLPDTGGAELCAKLRGIAPRLPLLLTSGRDQRALAISLSASGPTGFLPKPYMPQEIMQRIDELLRAAA
jgi:two-component system CheB/CheR fusion protein